MVAFAGWSGTIAAHPGENLVTPWLGVIERVSFLSPQIWYVVRAVTLLRHRPAKGEDGASELHHHIVFSEDGPRINYQTAQTDEEEMHSGRFGYCNSRAGNVTPLILLVGFSERKRNFQISNKSRQRAGRACSL